MEYIFLNTLKGTVFSSQKLSDTVDKQKCTIKTGNEKLQFKSSASIHH